MSENSPSDEFAPEWFIVTLGCGLPTRPLTILKNYDFPVENRGRDITNADVKSFLTRTKNMPSNVKYSNFHLLLYLAKVLDRDVIPTQTAAAIAASVIRDERVPREIEELVAQLR